MCKEHYIDSGSNLDGTLIIAAWRGHVDCVRALIDKGAKVKSNALRSALVKDREKCVTVLLEAGVDVNKQKEPSIITALKYDSHKCVNLLLNAGADVNKLEEPPIVTAARYDSHKCVSLFLNTGADGTQQKILPIATAASHGSHKCINVLLNAGADVNTKTRNGYTALMRAAQHEHTQCVKQLLHAGALVNVRSRNFHNALTELIFRRRGYQRLCMILLAAGETVGPTVGRRLNRRFRHSLERYAMIRYPVPKFLLCIGQGQCLKAKCRETIRNHLLDLDYHKNLFLRVPRLGLSAALNHYLLYEMSVSGDDDND